MARLFACLVVFFNAPTVAGEIPGLPASLPPNIERGLGLNFSNDFFGRGGTSDDLRTQQLILTARPSDRWTLLIDHSILTLRGAAGPVRTDQLSASVGYELLRRHDVSGNRKLAIGAGFRSVGDFAGERIQNGFHRLVQTGIEDLPYTAARHTDATAWFDAEYYTAFREPAKGAMFGNWRFGYWMRVNSLITSDAQWDASASLLAVANRRATDLWLGLRRDWRNGYNEPVLRQTAAAEDDLSIVLGLRFGAVVLETVQQLNNQASYGQLRLVSAGKPLAAPPRRFGIDVAISVPDVMVHFAGHTRTSLMTMPGSGWRESVFLSVDFGEPQHPDSNAIYIRSSQLGLGLEWERSLSAKWNWLAAYGSVGAGWRDERLVGDGVLAGEKSGSVGRAVVLLGTGIRADASALGSRGRFRIQLGLSGRVPIEDAYLQIASTIVRVQRPKLGLALGINFDFD